MESKFTWKTSETKEGYLVIKFTGGLNETNSLDNLVDQIDKFVLLDMEGVTYINSSGLASWLHFMSSLKRKNTNVVFVRCSIPVVQQMNMIPQFIANFKVKSFFAPYYCSACDTESSVLVDNTQALRDRLPCDNCSAQREFDEIADTYFSFLNSKK